MKPYYEDGSVTIYHGDCREILRDIEADVLVTDPPYGLDSALNSGGKRGRITPKDKRVVPEWDRDLRVRDEVLVLWGARPAAVFGSVTRESPPNALQRPLVWDKGESVGMGDTTFPWRPNYELVWIMGEGWSGRRTSSILRYPIAPAGRIHPTEKPVGLMRAIIGKAPAGIILDPFMGSGPTLMAAKDLGRHAIGIEIEERYCEIAAKRCSQEVLGLSA